MANGEIKNGSLIKYFIQSGGIGLAALFAYLMFNFLAENQKDTNAVIREISGAIQANTQAVQALDQYIKIRNNDIPNKNVR